MKVAVRAVAFVLLVVSMLADFSCAAAPQSPGMPGGTLNFIVENATTFSLPLRAAAPDRVELIYFHKQLPCNCMAVVGDNIKYAVDTYFGEEVASGRLKLTMVVSDDPASAGLLKAYNAMSFALFIKATYGGTEKVYPVAAIWEMTGDENRDRLVEFMKATVKDVLEGKTPDGPASTGQ